MNAPATKRAAAHPIPDAALDDRLAFVGTAGSGKTYNAGTAVERLLTAGARVVIPDPLGVWHGLRVGADGKTPAFPVVIFGGENADLPLTEHAGALIGETAATMAESCIVDVSGLGTKAAERRFMLAFLTALYRKTDRQPLHVVFDEADMWAPQMLSDKEGEAAKLLGIMEAIVRRGRIKGFIPWLITQRPAVLSKNVLSQVDGLVAMKLTSSQDRAALGDWIEGQADRAAGKKLLAEMPTLHRGEGVVWIPGRGILETAMFPRKTTFDSSRTPERGETKRTLKLKPLDMEALKARLGAVEAEIKANDPKALRRQVADLQRRLTAAEAREPAAPAIAADAIRQKAFAEGAASRDGEIADAHRRGFAEAAEQMSRAVAGLSAPPAPPPKAARAPAEVRPLALPPPRQPAPSAPRTPTEGLTGPQSKLLETLAWWRALGHDAPSKPQIAGKIGWAVTSSHLRNRLSELTRSGHIEPRGNGIGLTTLGVADAPTPSTSETLVEALRASLTGPQRQVFDALHAQRGALSREDVAAAVGWEVGSSHLRNRLSELARLEIITKRGDMIELQPWVWS